MSVLGVPKIQLIRAAMYGIAAAIILASGLVIYSRAFGAACEDGWTDIGGGECRIFLTTTGAGTITIPGNWNNSDNLIELIGGGGAGDSGTNGNGGGGGGAFASTSNLTLSGTIDYTVGAGGTAGADGGNAGGNTWFNGTTCLGATLCAGGGAGGTTSAGGAAGTVQTGSGVAGGAGGEEGGSTTDTGGGGGGAGGRSGVGQLGGTGDTTGTLQDGGGGGGGAGGGSSTAGTNGTANGGAGGAGPTGAGAGAGGTNANGGGGSAGGGGGGGDSEAGTSGGFDGGAGGGGTEWDATHGAGGGGGGAGNSNTPCGTGANCLGGAGGAYGGGGGGGLTGGAGGQGIIVITYAPVPPSFTQDNWRWYANADSLTPGSALAAENATTTGVATGDILRLRMNVSVATAAMATSSETFRLQYAEGQGCANLTNWADVPATTTSNGVGAFILGYDNPSVLDGATTTSLLLSNSTKMESYEEANVSTSTKNAVPVGGVGEWDWVIRNNGAKENTTYCFRMVKSDHTVFGTYTADGYPKLTTAAAPITEIHYRWRNDNGVEGTVTEFGTMGSTTSNGTSGEDGATSAAVDGTSIFVVGYDSTSSGQWRIEKRSTSDGSLITSFNSGGATPGVLTTDPTVNADEIADVAVDGNYIYLVGSQGTASSCDPQVSGDCAIRIEKRDKSTGALVTAFDTDGATTTDPSTGADSGVAVHVDESYLYAAGVDVAAGTGNREWFVMKLNKTTGAPCDGTANCAAGAFDSDGLLRTSISANTEQLTDIAGDGQYLYLAGFDQTAGSTDRSWRVEKRYKSTGALVTEFGTNGAVSQNLASAGSETIYGLAIDPGHIYLAGEAEVISTPAVNFAAVIQKRNIITGALCDSASACPDGAFSTDGYEYVNPSDDRDSFQGVVLDQKYLYLAGFTESTTGDWAVYGEKRDRSTGALCSASTICDSGAFGTGGVVETNPSTSNDPVSAMVGDSAYVYYVGYDHALGSTNRQWRVEKRYKDDGSYVTGVAGGASWSVAEDTASSTVAKSSTVRLRFSIRNNGNAGATTTSSVYKLRLQVAAKGGAASCTDVSGGSFSDVPVAGSCGSAVACMADSTNVTDGARTTPQLTAGATNFIFGDTVDNTSNQSATTTLYKDEYAEHEYAFQFTTNAADSTAYCLRLSDEGTALNTYSVVAEATTAGGAASAPTITTDSTVSYSPNTATLFGTITATGGDDADEHGFAYSTDSALSTGVSTTTLGAKSGTGSFSSSAASLSADTVYYYRAYATNGGGTGYGAIRSFTTGNTTPSRVMRLFEGFTAKLFDGTLKLYQQ